MDMKAFRKLSYGLYVVCALDAEGRKVGCIVNTFSQVANDPLNVCVSLNKDNVTAKAIKDTRRFTASCLTTDATMELIGRFGFNSSYNVDKFDGTPFALNAAGVPYITGSAVGAVFDVDVDQLVDVGSHAMFIGHVTGAEVASDGEPLTYAYYHSDMRGKTPPRAVSYVDGEAADAAAGADASDLAAGADVAAPAGKPRRAWRCTLCGYVEEGYPDGLPADYKCPWCGAGAEMFEPIEL